MGFWSVLLEIAKAVAPHAPHVARAVADAAKERRAAEAAREPAKPQPSTGDLANAINYLEQRLSAAEERAEAAEQKLSLAEARMADQWLAARKWALALIVWNSVVTLAVIVLIFVLARR